jgi:3-hydroxyisobutyrate dehydrogenase
VVKEPDGKEVVGFIGAGVMGRSMAMHLLRAGFPLNVYNRTKSKTRELVEQGAQWHDSAGDVAAVSDVIITIVGFPEDVEEVYFGEHGILAHARFGSVVVDMTTSSPALARRISEGARAKDVQALDAPVSGGDTGARGGRLSIMVGGEPRAFERVKPIFELMGRNILLQGPAGAGQHAKMCNQVAIASGMLGVCEAMAYAGKSGLDPATVLQSIESGAAGSWSLSNLTPRMLKGDFVPGFYVKHFIKDMKIAVESAESMGLDLPGLALARKMYEKLAAAGCENDGTQALFKLYQAEP